MAISIRLFEEPEKGMIRHNAISALLSEVQGANDFMGMMCEDLAPASTKVIEALTKYPASQEQTESAASVVVDVKEDLYTIISKDPARAKRSANAMSLGTKVPSHSISHFINNCGWENACPRKIIDVGGSNGDLCKALLERYGDIKTAISLDLPPVVAFQIVPDKFTGRLSYQGYNFFDEQPIRDVDVVLFRNLFHNWSDKYAMKILQNQIPALKPGSRIFVNETCIPDIDTTALAKDRVSW
jgi:SAM-dependent methyltransferase